mmetsp:Transcript_17269/g.31886  ORF Transcript_17269/g.31886 Transcript_17269/m.31886 type:complete len:270 (-) Transcript_17269:547-1356(-)
MENLSVNIGSDDSSNEGGHNIPSEIRGGPFEPQPQAAPDDCFASDDDVSGDIREYTGVFEGPEKTLEVCFRKMDSEAPPVLTPTDGRDTRHTGLRRLSRDDLSRICARARCTILSCVSNNYVDAYVLSESSLFVYPYMLVLKTCGTTTLLRCIALLIDMGRKLGLEIDWVGYSRKNFNFPGDQAFPHQSFHQELDYLYSHRNVSHTLRTTRILHTTLCTVSSQLLKQDRILCGKGNHPYYHLLKNLFFLSLSHSFHPSTYLLLLKHSAL